MKLTTILLITTFAIMGCARTSIQPLSQNTFKVATNAAPACGEQGARKVVFEAAAIQVIQNGGDRFVIIGDTEGSQVTGGQFTGYGYYQTYNSHQQYMIVRMLKPGEPEYGNGLSARTILGPNWQEIVSKGISNTCTRQ